MGVFGFEFFRLGASDTENFKAVDNSSKPSSPARVTHVSFKLIRPVVCLESEFKDCNLA